MVIIRNNIEINLIKMASRIVAEVFTEVERYCKPGVTTGSLDKIAEDKILTLSGKPAFKGYMGYPSAICASVNEQVVHGIPNNIPLKNGDILGVDIGVMYKGYFGDAARTFAVGDISSSAKKLISVASASLDKAIDVAVDGNRLGDIGHAIQSYVESNGMSVVRDYVGHGIGTRMHEDPQIPNYGTKGQGILLKAGMVFAIEPMVNLGGYGVKTLKDKWTVVTKDGTLSAHFEDTVVITKKSAEILTRI